MKQINKKARDKLVDTLTQLKHDLEWEILNHAITIKQSVEDQQVRKRQRQAYDEAIYTILNK